MAEHKLHRRAPGFLSAMLVIAIQLSGAAPVLAADPIKVGIGISSTGNLAPLGKQVLSGLEIWRDDVNAKGGLLGRPVELVHYDDQSSPANIPTIYTRLISVDKVDLLLGPYATNSVAAAMPVIMQKKMTTIGIFGFAANSEFKYDRYFSMNAQGASKPGLSRGFFELAAKQNPKPQTIALLGADAEFGHNAIEGARANAKEFGFKIVYDRLYPPTTTDFTPIMRAVKETKPDLVYAAAYVLDTVGIVRSANETQLEPKMFGGALLGLLATPIKLQLGKQLNGIVSYEFFVPSEKMNFSGAKEFIAKYQVKAQGAGIDPLGLTFPPYAYAAGQVLEAAVNGTKSLDQDKIAAFMRSNKFSTVVGEVAFEKGGEWQKPRNIYSQFQSVTGSGIGEFKDMSRQKVLWPSDLTSGSLIYPYADAKK